MLSELTHPIHPVRRLSRREWLRLSSAGIVGFSLSGWLESLADDAAGNPARRRSCILLWMNGGPSQMDTFDLKPGHANGGPFKEIETAVPGIRISEHLPKLARQMEHIAIVRSMSTREGDHSRATYLMRTGYLQQGPIRYPTLGSLVAKELGSDEAELPNFVSIAPFRVFNQAAYGPGFLGSQYAPLTVGDGAQVVQPQPQAQGDFNLRVDDLEPPRGVTREETDSRLDLWRWLEDGFVSRHATPAAVGHRTAYERAVKMMRSEAVQAFNLDEESPAVRDAYGRNRFGQGCLMARRLVERGVPFVEVTLAGLPQNQVAGWDTHQNNFDSVRRLSEVLDPAWSTLIEDLKSHALLDSTLIVWMGEFGRTPKINGNNGRDHFPQAWSTVLAGGGIRGGQVIGRTSADGMSVEDRPVSVPDLLATACRALGIDPLKQNMSDLGRPIRIVDKDAKPIQEVLA
jgi:hypothetical protein